MITVLQRVCWNTENWQAPSGDAFDSGNPGKYGYGNEEWNFCTGDAFHGSVYGFLYWQPARQTRKEHFQIAFWTIPPKRKVRLLVGLYQDAVLATDQELTNLELYFRESGIYKRRLEELLTVINEPSRRIHANKNLPRQARGLRFKCAVDQVVVLEPPRVLPKLFGGKRASTRFKNPTLLKKPLLISALVGGALPPKPYVSPLIEDVYLRATPASLKMINPQHKRLSNEYVKWLAGAGFRIVGREADRVDVEFKDGAKLCRAELKVCDGITTRQGIREALGQLFEYNYYGARRSAEKWVIVLDRKPLEADAKYLIRLVSERHLPLELCWRCEDGFERMRLRG